MLYLRDPQRVFRSHGKTKTLNEKLKQEFEEIYLIKLTSI